MVSGSAGCAVRHHFSAACNHGGEGIDRDLRWSWRKFRGLVSHIRPRSAFLSENPIRVNHEVGGLPTCFPPLWGEGSSGAEKARRATPSFAHVAGDHSGQSQGPFRASGLDPFQKFLALVGKTPVPPLRRRRPWRYPMRLDLSLASPIDEPAFARSANPMCNPHRTCYLAGLGKPSPARLQDSPALRRGAGGGATLRRESGRANRGERVMIRTEWRDIRGAEDPFSV